jgi:hypothetical protein
MDGLRLWKARALSRIAALIATAEDPQIVEALIKLRERIREARRRDVTLIITEISELARRAPDVLSLLPTEEELKAIYG